MCAHGHVSQPLASYSESPGPSANKESELSVGGSRSLTSSDDKGGHARTRTHKHTQIDRQKGTQKREGMREKREGKKKRKSHIYSKVKQNRLHTPRGTEK